MSRHKLLGIGSTVGLTLASLAMPLAASPALATTGTWVATHTQAVTVNGTALGAAAPHRKLRISVALPLRRTDRMQQLIQSVSDPASADYGHFLTVRQVRHRFGPQAATVADVETYLADQGFTHISHSRNRLLVTATGTVGEAERAFDTQIGMFRVEGKRVYANTRAASVPATLARDVVAVLGLSNFAMNLPYVRTDASPNCLQNFAPYCYTAKEIQKVYDATLLPAAKHTEIALIASGDMTGTIENLRGAEEDQNFPQVPVNVIYTGPKKAIVNNNPLTGSLEWDLDFQISTMEAQAVKRLDVYDIATYTDSDVARGINKFVSDNKALTLSASLGECDALAYVDGAMITTDQALAEGALQGQSAFASTGDNGSFCPEGASTGVPGGGPGDSWPSSGEYTTAVGGTTLIADDQGSVTAEAAWAGGGGGVSAFATAGPWTLQANALGQTWEYNNFGGRGVPDVSAVADGNTGVLVYVGNGTYYVVGGTSVSSPLVSGLWARIEGVHHNKLGLASYRFYEQYNAVNPGTALPDVLIPTYAPNQNPQPVPGFNDILVGGNGLYSATPGYDYTTGIGTLDVAVLSKQLGTEM